jgi:hypothetical protein
MASSFLLEELSQGDGISLAQGAKRFPPYRQNRPVTPSCLSRWATRGVRGPDGQRVRLETARLAGRRITTPQAIARFLEAQTPRFDDSSAPSPNTRNAQRRATERAAAELDRHRI